MSFRPRTISRRPPPKSRRSTAISCSPRATCAPAPISRRPSHGVEEFGGIDILVANAGIWALASLWEMTDDQWQDMIDVNLTGVWRTLRAVIPTMIRQQRGSIVLTASVNGLEAGAGYAHYVAAKHGVVGLMRNTALELGRLASDVTRSARASSIPP